VAVVGLGPVGLCYRPESFNLEALNAFGHGDRAVARFTIAAETEMGLRLETAKMNNTLSCCFLEKDFGVRENRECRAGRGW